MRGHKNTRGNDLVDMAAKLVVPSTENIPEQQRITVTIGKQAKRQPCRVIYTNNPIAPPILLATGPDSVTISPPWWTIPEEERHIMHAFTSTSNQLCLKVNEATL